ncbi:MAG: Fe3+-hydroxamate transporter substrate-binding protein, partial [Clostridia bacterium]|nr:Fe3+-hydroxamate transporter substrate-binding protein [Clostridia bacterium]
MHTKWTKKVGGLFLVATVTVAALTGCGGQTKTPQEETVTKNSAVNTRIVSTSKGEVEVPEKPERVVVNWYIGEVFTLGIKPIAANAWAHETMPFYDQFEGVSIIEK